VTWHNYTVTIYDGSNPPRTVTIRGISLSDVEYVAFHPCQRNQFKPVANEQDGIVIQEQT
jgi:hypothetical protein